MNKALACEMQGLSAAEASRRLSDEGPNALVERLPHPWLRLLLEVAREPMFLLLLAAAAVYLLLGDRLDGFILCGFVLIAMGLTLYQGGKTARAIEALRGLTSPRALVIRDGVAQRIAGRDVVRGDLLLLSEGDRVPADATLLSANDLQVDESLLTGEAVPVSKIAASGENQAARAGGDNLPFVYSGTLVVRGRGSASVTATGPRSEIGRIGKALQSLETERSPLYRQTARLVQTLAFIALFLSLLLVAVYGLVRGDWLQALLAGIALAMAILPQEYTMVLTIFPALGAWRLSQEKVLTRRIAAIETLGATSVLCADKTGTLTGNRMTVTRLWAGSDGIDIDYAAPPDLPEAFHALVEYAILASETDPFDPMEKAFHRLGEHFLANTEHLHRDWSLVHEYSLTPQLRAMSHVWASTRNGVHVVAAKGAPEAIADLCHLDAAAQAKMAAAALAMAAQGMRVLAVAQARFNGRSWPEIQHDFEFDMVGLLGLADPVRPEIPQAVRECHEAGIRVVMITGDYPATACAVARQTGLDAETVLSGESLAGMSDAELQRCMQTATVCARIAPEQKLRIVQALQANGEIVAMTGDGVNDAPALKAAHVGIAMGGRGTDVAREAASLILLDDNFAAIVRAIRLGRRIFDNMRKSMAYILAVHIPIAGMALLPVLLGWPTVLYPAHIAFLELVIDPACSIVFENEPAEAGIMRRRPRDAKTKLFGGAALMLAFLQGAWALLLVVAAYAWANTCLTEPEARAFVFVTLVTVNIVLIFFNRLQSRSLLIALRTPNFTLWAVTGATLAILAVSLYLPLPAHVLRFAPLSAERVMLATALGLVSMTGFQWLKLAYSRNHDSRD